MLLRKTSFAKKFNINVYLFTLLFIVIITASSVLVRNYHQVGDIKNVFGFLMIEVAHWPQYLGFLISGIIASQTNLFKNFPSVYGKCLLVIGLIMATKVYFPSYFPDIINDWAGKYFELFETILGFSLSFGLLVFFRDHFNKSSKLLSVLSENAYAAYIFHYPMVISIQYCFDKTPLPPLAKFIVVGLLSISISFAFSYVFRQPKFIRRIL